MAPPKKSTKPALRWLRLDNAAKIYPAARRQQWSNIYRISVTLKEPVDPQILQQAVNTVSHRFPSLAARLRRGVFWYYLQELSQPPRVRPESGMPLTRMGRDEIRRCALRVLYYKNRIAIELFHSLADGNGALIFLKTLTAQYLQERYGIPVPKEQGVLDCQESPREEELEDSFQKYAGPLVASRRENNAWRIEGTPLREGLCRQTCFTLPVDKALETAHRYGVSLTVFLCAVTMDALQKLQKETGWSKKPIKVMVPVDLRRMFPSSTLRNFAMYTTPELLPRLGNYEFSEICQLVRHWIGMDATPKKMGMRIAANISNERSILVKLMPLFVKNAIMKLVFNAVGEKKSCLSVSNLGSIQIPREMEPFVERFDFILGVPASTPYNCGILSYGNTLYINFTRNIQEPALEYYFHKTLQGLGLTAQVQSSGERS